MATPFAPVDIVKKKPLVPDDPAAPGVPGQPAQAQPAQAPSIWAGQQPPAPGQPQKPAPGQLPQPTPQELPGSRQPVAQVPGGQVTSSTQPEPLTGQLRSSTQPQLEQVTSSTQPEADPIAQVTTAFQTRFGRAMNPQEQNALQQALGYTGGPITPELVAQALQLIQQYDGSLGGAPGQPGQPTPGQPGAQTPPGTIDPNQALTQANAAFQARLGRPMSPQEQEALISALGYTGGNVTDAQIAQALDWISRYSGRLDDPWGSITPPPEPQTVDGLIQQLLNRGMTFDPNDPVFKGQTDAFQRANQRSTARKRAALAERAAARGGINAGGFDVDTERLLSEQGENEQAFEANLAGQELNKQRDQVMRALEIGAGRLSDQERNALTQKLADLDAAIRREGLSLQKLLGMRGLDLQALGLGQQNAQFYDNLGAQVGLNEAQLNQNATLALLNGGR